MDIRHHRTDIPRTIGFTGFWEFDGLEVFGRGCVPVHCIPFIDGIDSSFFGDAHLVVRMGLGMGVVRWDE